MVNPTSKLEDVVREFSGLEPRERLELLADFSDHLPPLPPHYQAQRDAGQNRVHECQTPVFLWVEVRDGHVQLYADVAPEAPTVRGFVALLVESFSGASTDEVIATKTNLMTRLGLVEALGMVRMRGLHAILNRIRSEVLKAVNATSEATP